MTTSRHQSKHTATQTTPISNQFPHHLMKQHIAIFRQLDVPGARDKPAAIVQEEDTSQHPLLATFRLLPHFSHIFMVPFGPKFVLRTS